ncbi:MAG: hypothetical protein ACXAEU_14125 [Candidatus Hodarchaeales archaeon]
MILLKVKYGQTCSVIPAWNNEWFQKYNHQQAFKQEEVVNGIVVLFPLLMLAVTSA